MRQELTHQDTKLEEFEQTIHQLEVDQHGLLEDLQTAASALVETLDPEADGECSRGDRNHWQLVTRMGAHGGDQRLQTRHD